MADLAGVEETALELEQSDQPVSARCKAAVAAELPVGSREDRNSERAREVTGQGNGRVKLANRAVLSLKRFWTENRVKLSGDGFSYHGQY